jgi:molecular chaperone GrpE
MKRIMSEHNKPVEENLQSEKQESELQPEAQEPESAAAGSTGESSTEPVGPELAQIDVDALQKELEDTQAKASEYLDGWQRARADFANYKRRIEREQAQVYQVAAGNVLKRYLEVSDDLERALKNRPQDGEGAIWANGVELIYRKLVAILEAEGVKLMEAEGQFFDPNFHEAISQEESAQHESGKIIEVLQPGYMLGDRVLRPARVRVAK